MKFKRRVQGVISIFLILIMVPTMVLSAVLVDGSRMRSAKAITQEAADLAASSVLSNYQMELKERYGLLAFDNSAEVESIFKECLMATLSASGIGGKTEYSEKVWDILKDTLGMGHPYQNKKFLNLYDFKFDEVEVTPMYSLANYQVLQSQIVEYSKYRGAYVIAERLELLNSVQNLSKYEEEKQAGQDAMNEKMDIDDKNKDVDFKLEELNQAINEYNKSLEQITGIEEKYFDSLIAKMQMLSEKLDRPDNQDILDGNEKEIIEKSKKLADCQESLVNRFSVIENKAKYVMEKAGEAGALTDKALKRLEDFQEKYKDTQNETVKELLEDNKRDLEMYRGYYKADIQALQNRVALKNALSISTKVKNLLTQIKKCVTSYSKEEQNEDSDYLFYYLTKDTLVMDKEHFTPVPENVLSGDAEEDGKKLGTYASSYIMVAGTVVTMGALDPNRNYCENIQSSGGTKAQDQDLDTKAKAVSEEGDKAKDNSQGSGRKEIPESVYGQLPSKTFDPSTEGKSYGIQIDTDITKVEADNSEITNYKFYNENGDLTECKNLLNQKSFLSNLGEVTRDQVLTMSYLFGTFRTRMSGLDKFKKGKVDESKLAKPYMVEWRFLYEEGEQNMRFQPKNAESPTQLRAEIEYLLYGAQSDKSNEDKVYSTIMATRLANNMFALYLNKEVKSVCRASAVATSALFPLIPPTVYFWLYLTAWATSETIIEMNYLISDGYRIPLIKTSKNVLLTIDLSDNTSTDLIDNYENGPKWIPYVCYEDYLMLLLLCKGTKSTMMRTADLIEMNMKLSDPDFAMSKSFTTIRAASGISIRYLFQTAPVFDDEYENAGLTGRLRFTSTVYQGY